MSINIDDALNDHIMLFEKINLRFKSEIINISSLLSSCLLHEGTIFWCGNGGSAADCQHLAAELVGRFNNERRPLRSIALTTDSSVLTCIANDYSFESIYSRQIEALAKPSDVLIGISTSGNSKNISNALETAQLLGVKTVGLLGKSGGHSLGFCDHSIVIPSLSTARIQEAHIFIGHLFCELIEHQLNIS